MPPFNTLLREVVCTEDPQKALFVVRSNPGAELKGMACSVTKRSGKVFLVTCTDVASHEDIGRNDGEGLVADRFCTQYPKHLKKHRIKIRDIRNDDKFSFIPLSKASDFTFIMCEEMNGHFTKPCQSFAVIDNKETKRVEWSYDSTRCRHVISRDHDLGNSAILGSPVLWTNRSNTTFVVGVVGSDGDSLLPIFFENNSHKIPDLPKAVTLNELPDEVSGNKITFRWSRVEGALSYRVYKRITTQDGDGNEWERVMLTTDDSCEIKVERGKTYQFKVIGVNKDDDEGKESNIRTVKVLDVPRPVKFVDLPSEISENNLTMRWSKPGDNGTQITHYTVYQRVLSEDGSVPEWTPLIWVPANQRLEFEVSGMETGKTYEFQVTATNKCGEGPEVQESIKRVKVSIDETPDNLISFLDYVWKLFHDWWNGNTD